MAFIRPFRAWRYNEEVIQDVNLKFSPLFDVVSREEMEELYKIPNNSIHLSVPKSEPETLAKMQEWREKKIIRQDSLPGIYIYYQEFSLYGEGRKYVRKGFVSMVRLNPESGSPDIILHEKTITHSVAERTNLLEKTLLNVAPTHGLYEDPDFELEKLMDAYMEHPQYEYIDYQGVINKLAIVQNKAEINAFVDLMRTKKIYLADGHHRLESSRLLQKMHLQASKNTTKEGESSAPAQDSMKNYHLMYLTNLCSDDLRILPIHRVLRLPTDASFRVTGKGIDPKPFLKALSSSFELREITLNKAPIYHELRDLNRSFGMILGSHQYILTLKSEIDPEKEIPLDLPQSVKNLDYTLLHYFIFEKVFGMPYANQGDSHAIVYEKDYYRAVKAGMEEEGTVSFITRGLDMSQMMAVCREGALMPQKSTYFYPKVVCGLLFASINDDENNTPFDLSFGFTPAETTPD